MERSTTGTDWKKVGTVLSHSNSTKRIAYHYVDTSPMNGVNLYRLKMTDKDGTYEYSRIISTVIDQLTLSVYPNPTVDSFSIDASVQVKELKIFDLTGREISQSNYRLLSNNYVQFNSISGGTYLVKVTDIQGLSTIRKLVVLK